MTTWENDCSPNSCLPTWGPSGESLYLVVVRQLFPAPTASFLSHVLANIQNFEVRHNTSTIVTINVIKNDEEIHQSWSLPFLPPGPHVHFRSKTKVIPSFCGLPNFVCVYILFIFLIFHQEILAFYSVHDFLISSWFYFCCISSVKVYICWSGCRYFLLWRSIFAVFP